MGVFEPSEVAVVETGEEEGGRRKALRDIENRVQQGSRV
jgi:hypothetical protein